MGTKRNKKVVIIWVMFVLAVYSANSQMSPDIYEKADDLAKRTAGKVFYGNVQPVWIGKTNCFLYENLTPEGTEYLIVDAEKLSKKEGI